VAIRYLGRHARITDDVIESYCPQYQQFPIRELELIHTVRPPAAVRIAASQPVRVCSAGATGLAVMFAVLGQVLHNAPVGAGGVGALVLAVATVTASARGRRRPSEIRAVHRGQLVCLFSTTDRYALGQVARALLRVLEARSDDRESD
jgi:hypothetical protein